tara:strand:+ start:114 stop:581 length:468 start_codon:yes stop_codon:yes gene_type:complete
MKYFIVYASCALFLLTGCLTTPTDRDKERHINRVFNKTMNDQDAVTKASISGSRWAIQRHTEGHRMGLKEVVSEEDIIEFLPDGTILYSYIVSEKKIFNEGKWIQNGSKVSFTIDLYYYNLCTVTISDDDSGNTYMGGACYIDTMPERFATLYKL